MHVLVSVRYREARPDDTFYLYENVMLLEYVDESEDLWELAEREARLNYIESECRLEDRPAFEKFEGIRKIVAVSSPELTYFQLEVASEEDIEKLLARRPVSLLCFDDEIEDEDAT